MGEIQKMIGRKERKRQEQLVEKCQEQVDEAKGKNCNDEEEAAAKIAEYSKNHSETGQYEYLVRGATLICSNGSHKRKINLPKCHGVYVGEHPVLHELECKSETECGLEKCNIPFFGVCIPAEGDPPPTDIKTYITTKENCKAGVSGTITGYKCEPEIIGQWYDVYEATKIVDNGDKNPADRMKAWGTEGLPEGQNTVTTGSFLVCKYGGLIEPIDSGQNTLVTAEDFYSYSDYESVKQSSSGSRKKPVEKNEDGKTISN